MFNVKKKQTLGSNFFCDTIPKIQVCCSSQSHTKDIVIMCCCEVEFLKITCTYY